ncbi:hypothetical protein Syun_029714 [Stephania yunnanensis]|uniref:Uncharacterized protein n=1 Tax=Stephania yunnanensis TaxID=152371 RepID=A0AAP0E8H4_9MAGN
MIFYPQASMALGRGFRPLAFPTMGLEYVGAIRVHKVAWRDLLRSLILNAIGPMGFKLDYGMLLDTSNAGANQEHLDRPRDVHGRRDKKHGRSETTHQL